MIEKEQLLGAIRELPPGAQRIRVAFALTRVPQRIMARRLKMSQSTVSLIATGQRDASAEERAVIAGIFGLQPADLFGEAA